MAQMIVLTGVRIEVPPALMKALEDLGCQLAPEIAVFAEFRDQPAVLSEDEAKKINASVTGGQSAKVEIYLST